jgi:hypothetical protein
VVDPHWQGTGPEFSLELRAVSLSLNVEKAIPGIELADSHGMALLLALDGLARAGRTDRRAFGPQSLVGWDVIRGRLEATFAPKRWEGLTVRAAWTPMPSGDGVDLEIQASANSAAKYKHVEVLVSSRWALGDCGLSPELAGRVEARDAQSAAQSYDGREPAAVLANLTTLPLATSWATALEPLMVAIPGARGPLYYVEMVQPDDVARRIVGVPAGDQATSQLVLSARYGLLGHDIEKGVVLRARLRGNWIESVSPKDEAQTLWREFLEEPLPLGP